MRKRISVISGGDSGMGLTTAQELGKESVLVLAARNEQKLQSAKQELDKYGFEVYVFKTDVQNEANVKELAAFSASLGDVVHIIHAAGVSPARTDAESIMAITAVGTVNMVEAFYPVIAEAGVMINFGSIAAHMKPPQDAWHEVFDTWRESGFKDRLNTLTKPAGDNDFMRAALAYTISKRFVIYITQKNVMRFAKKGCRILSVSPGYYLTPMHQALIEKYPDSADSQLAQIPCGRWGHPYEIAALIAFLCSKGAGFINGVDILADAGQCANLLVKQI